MRTARRGAFSLVEILVAGAILATGAMIIFESLSDMRYQAQRTDVTLAARMLAQCILEQSLHRLHTRDLRFHQLTTSPSIIVADALRGRWKQPFIDLAQPNTPVITAPGAPNPYFDPEDGPALPTGATEDPFWRAFSYEVRVSFDVRADLSSDPVPIDADGDGSPERDLAAIEVEVFHLPPGEKGSPRSVARLISLALAQDRVPGFGILEGGG